MSSRVKGFDSPGRRISKDYKMNQLRGTGIIQYDPPRPGMQARTQWWSVATLNREITRYYRWWLEFEKHIRLQPPAWDAHISIVRGEKPRPEFMDVWKKHQGKQIEFFYKHGAIRVDRSQRTDDRADKAIGGDYYFIDVKCPFLDEVRTELGLRTGFSYHFTIGRTYEYEARKPKRPIKK